MSVIDLIPLDHILEMNIVWEGKFVVLFVIYYADYSFQAEHEKSQLTTNLKESQEGLEKTRQELDAQHARVSHLLGHISALVKLHDQENPNQVRHFANEYNV